MVCDGALRLGDGAARDLGRFRGLARDLADRGGKLLDRACRRGDVLRGGADALSAVRDSADTASAALLSLVEDDFELLRRAAQLAERLLDRVLGSARSSRRSLSLRCSRLARGLGLRPRSAVRARSCCRGTRSRCAPWRRSRPCASVAGILAEVSPSASRFIDVGQAVERAGDAAADQPAEAQADQHGGDADADDDGAGPLLRRRERRRRRVGVSSWPRR